MPASREEHVWYTRNEYTHYPYYVELFNVLKTEDIKTYLDIGANVGEVCNVYFDFLPSLEFAYLIEPEPENYNFLLKHVKTKNYKSYDCAIGYGYKNPVLLLNSNVGGAMLGDSQSAHKSSLSVKTLEELNLPNVDLIKMDIEGGEYNIIENSSYLKNAKFIEIEFHDYSGDKPIVEYVTKTLPNYSIVVLESIGGRYLLKKN
jgi:FkbM family methyltransferase